jgi:hypothetical protein
MLSSPCMWLMDVWLPDTTIHLLSPRKYTCRNGQYKCTVCKEPKHCSLNIPCYPPSFHSSVLECCTSFCDTQKLQKVLLGMTYLLGLRLSSILSNSNCLPKPYRLTVGVRCVQTVGCAPVMAYPVIAGGLCMPPTGVTNRYKES